MFVAVTSSSNLVRFFPSSPTRPRGPRRVHLLRRVRQEDHHDVLQPGISSTSPGLRHGCVRPWHCRCHLQLQALPTARGVRNIIGDFAPTIAVGVGVVFAQWLAGNYGFNFEALSLPASAPTANRPGSSTLPRCLTTSRCLPLHACAILLYMDQNITTCLVNNSAGLKPAAHLDMFWLSISPPSPPCAALDSPPSTPSPVKSLSDTAKDPATGVEKVTNVTETRWTPLVLNLLIGLSIVCLKPVLAQIPMCVLSVSSSTSVLPGGAVTSSSSASRPSSPTPSDAQVSPPCLRWREADVLGSPSCRLCASASCGG